MRDTAVYVATAPFAVKLPNLKYNELVAFFFFLVYLLAMYQLVEIIRAILPTTI